MHNEFTAIIEKDENWYIAYCPEFQEQMVKGELLKNVNKIFLKQLL